jgi:hypothetical protein
MKQQRNSISCYWRTLRQILCAGVAPLLILLALPACKPAPTMTNQVNPAGTYSLVSVDGKTVPCEIQHEGHKLTIKSGTFIISADGTCSSKMVFTPPSGGDATREVKASFTRNGARLTMKWEGAGTTVGTVEGDLFRMNNEGMVLAYKK